MKFKMAGLGLLRRWACWVACGEAALAGLWSRRLVGVISWAGAGLEPVDRVKVSSVVWMLFMQSLLCCTQ